MGLVYRWLEGEELKQLEPILEAHGWSSLNGKTCRAYCAFEDGKLVAFNVIQLHPLVGPMWVAPQSRGGGIAEEMADRMVEWLASVQARGYLVIADSPVSRRLCEEHGMELVKSPVFRM